MMDQQGVARNKDGLVSRLRRPMDDDEDENKVERWMDDLE